MQELFSRTYCALYQNAPMLIYSPAKIIKLRVERGWNQSELARAAKLSSPTIWALEHGETKMPKFSTIERVAAALGVPAPQIMADEQPTDIEQQISSAVGALTPANKGAVLAAALAFLESQKRK